MTSVSKSTRPPTFTIEQLEAMLPTPFSTLLRTPVQPSPTHWWLDMQPLVLLAHSLTMTLTLALEAQDSEGNLVLKSCIDTCEMAEETLALALKLGEAWRTSAAEHPAKEEDADRDT